MGIGGGFFMNIYIKWLLFSYEINKNRFKLKALIFIKLNRSENKSYFINARERAPLNAHRDMYLKNPELALVGGLAT